ncbi:MULTISPECIES: threonine/serine exporter family protein [Metabacillus]|uniref:Threonine/serine exporter family protein n=1 Tax=Metabacillus rhizolycopersici TaxID=2875709 RepID=A0ABS7UY49_9BACI|nr:MULTISPECIES: threonine/serine exporter family protein [Metabacillus]MBZ5753241.1 threonine/serine exporter family protein [Metabacillus rhizolycopersici]MCM3653190.1 threonine/serine exporter family protein [Metabacillus litoralis]
MIEHLITSFIASAAFGIIFNAPVKTLLKCGFVGMVGWMIYMGITYYTMDSIFASVIASFAIAIISQYFAKVFKTPVIIFNVSGIIPLVPGGKAYDAMRRVVEGNFNAAIPLSAEVVLISGSIAIGLVLSEVINQIIRKGSLRKSI